MTYSKDENPAYTMHELQKLERRVRRNKIIIGGYIIGALALAGSNIVSFGTKNGMETDAAVSLAAGTCLIIASLFGAAYVFKLLVLDDNQKKLNSMIEKIRWNPAPLLGVVRPPSNEIADKDFNIVLKKWWNHWGTNG